jgi:hypothetical protein
MISSSQRHLPENTRHSQQTNIHAPGGIRTHNLSRRAAADLRLRPRCHWDRLYLIYILILYFYMHIVLLSFLLLETVRPKIFMNFFLLPCVPMNLHAQNYVWSYSEGIISSSSGAESKYEWNKSAVSNILSLVHVVLNEGLIWRSITSTGI